MDFILDALPIKDLILPFNKKESECARNRDHRNSRAENSREYYDLELLAKYVYARRAKLEPELLKDLPECYLTSPNGLRRYFVNEDEKVINFKAKEDGCSLKYFMDNYLGFSHYAYNKELCYFYFVNFSDVINKTPKLQQSSYLESDGGFNRELNLLANTLLPLLEEIKVYSEDNFFMDKKQKQSDPISFIFDVLHYRSEIHSYVNGLNSLFSPIFNIYKEQKTDVNKGFVLYFIVFYAMNLLNGKFHEEWKCYYPYERPYEKLKKMAKAYKDYFDESKGENKIKGKSYIGLSFIYLLDLFIASSELMPKFKGEDVQSTQVFLFSLKGGIVRLNSWSIKLWDKLKLKCSEQTAVSRELCDHKLLESKGKSNRQNPIKLDEAISHIKRKMQREFTHYIYAIFTRCIAYYSKSNFNSKSRDFLVKSFCHYMPDDFIHGDFFGYLNGEYRYNEDIITFPMNRERFFEGEFYLATLDYKEPNVDIEYTDNINTYLSRHDGNKYYKSNFFQRLSEYSCVTIENYNGCDASAQSYQDKLEKCIEDICTQLLSDATGKTQ